MLGAGDADLREELKELRRLAPMAGGFMGRLNEEVGVPGAEGMGDCSVI